MKKHIFKNLVLTAIVGLGLGSIPLAHADEDHPTGEFLGAASASNTDVYVLSCPIGTANVKAKVNDGTALGIEISVQVINPNGLATSQTAPDGGIGSDDAVLSGGAGNYLVTVHKNLVGGEGYTISADCYDSAEVPAPGLQLTLVQDQ
jgi:hypothetical protein